MTQLPPPLREIQWQTGHDTTGCYVEGRVVWRGEHCDFRTYLAPREEQIDDAMIGEAIYKVTMQLGLLLDHAYPEDMTGWREAMG